MQTNISYEARLFVHERRFGYLYVYSNLGNVDQLAPLDLRATSAVDNGILAEQIAGPPVYPMIGSGSRSWPWYSVSVLLPLDVRRPYEARILVAGGSATKLDGEQGHPRDRLTAAAEIFDYNARLPIRRQFGRNFQLGWRPIAPMRFRRTLCDSTILANGDILVTGGTPRGFANANMGTVLETELFNPDSESWSTMEPSPTDRRYHSIAALLEDGTVLKAGSHGGLIPELNNIRPQFHADIFQPSYLWRSPRSKVLGMDQPRVGATRTLTPGELHWIEVARDDDGIFRLALARFGGVTHGNYMDQRFIWLDVNSTTTTIHRNDLRDPTPIHRGSGVGTMGGAIPEEPVRPLRPATERAWRVSFVIPKNPTLFPPGQYMLFVLNQFDVPSIAEFITIYPESEW